MTEKTKLQFQIRNAKITLILGILALLTTPIVFFLFTLIGIAVCPPSVYGECEFNYSLSTWQNGITFTILWAVVAIITIISGGYKFRKTTSSLRAKSK